ncbi:MAG TPA: Gfo/Idh/MocA family oxidoreductase, partial [Tepidisphaeraceae bacterium]|nr:Gfo/Idh/MocA family oxidoreductase [Tepidisphaeraceae bacterium]
MAKKRKDYGLAVEAATRAIKAPDLPYRPRDPKKYRPAIGLIACGGITEQHLKAYKAAGYNVVALCDADGAKAEKRREEFYPRARVYSDYRKVLKRDDIEVVDVATHPEERLPIIRAAIKARKHVLSQKPFVIDLDEGQRLV